MSSSVSPSLSDVEVTKWLGAEEGFSPPSGKVVAIHAFQMLCPGCVLHGVPQAQKLNALFDEEHVVVLGLHTVFENHEAMQETSLKAFMHEFRIRFPVGIDVPSAQGSIPKTMTKFQLQGTPSWLIFDRSGQLKVHAFGQVEDMLLGSEIARIAYEGLPAGAKIHRAHYG